MTASTINEIHSTTYFAAESNFVREEIKANKNNSKILWKTIRRYIPACDMARTTQNKERSVIAKEFNEFFTSVGEKAPKKAEKIAQIHALPANTNATENRNISSALKINQFRFRTVSCKTVQEIVSNMPKNKAPGPDKISLRFIADCLPHIIQSITDLINTSLVEGTFPQAWKEAEVTPIPANTKERRS